MSKNTSYILISILSLLLGGVIIVYHSQVESKVMLIIGIGLIVLGVFNIISSFFKNGDEKKKSTLIGDIVIGVVIIGLGIVLLLDISVVNTAITVVLGAFFILEGIRRIVYGIKTYNKNPGWFIALVLAIIVIGGGVFFILKRDLATDIRLLLVGIALIVLGIQGVIAVLSGKKNNKKEKVEKKDKNDKKIKA